MYDILPAGYPGEELVPVGVCHRGCRQHLLHPAREGLQQRNRWNLADFHYTSSRIFITIQIELYMARKKDISISGYKYMGFLTLN